jgi:hypothetical protein
MNQTTKYKLRRTFRPWDVLTVGGVGGAMAGDGGDGLST